jgi:hypothetical protein
MPKIWLLKMIVFRYTPELGLWYSASSSLSLLGFSDADFVGCRVDRKSTSGTCQFLGSSLVSWSSRKQSSVAQSTTEAEYVVAASCCSKLLWITYTLSDFGEECSHVPRDGNGDPIPDSPWGIHPLGDGDGNSFIPTGNQTGQI